MTVNSVCAVKLCVYSRPTFFYGGIVIFLNTFIPSLIKYRQTKIQYNIINNTVQYKTIVKLRLHTVRDHKQNKLTKIQLNMNNKVNLRLCRTRMRLGFS